MSDLVQLKNLGALIDIKALVAALSWTAGAAADGAPLVGAPIDRAGFANGAIPRCMDVDVCWSATLSAGHTLAFALDLQHSPDDVTWSDYVSVASTIVATGSTSGGQQTGVYRMNPLPADSATPGVDLGSAARYLRLTLTPHLSAPAGDTATIAALGVFGGFDALPAPLS